MQYQVLLLEFGSIKSKSVKTRPQKLGHEIFTGLWPLLHHLRGSRTAVLRHWSHNPITLLIVAVIPTAPSLMFANSSLEMGIVKSHRVANSWAHVLERSLENSMISLMNIDYIISTRKVPVYLPRLDGSLAFFTVGRLPLLLHFPQRVDTSHGIAG